MSQHLSVIAEIYIQSTKAVFQLMYTLWRRESRIKVAMMPFESSRLLFQEIRMVPSARISISWPDLRRKSSSGETATMGIGF